MQLFIYCLNGCTKGAKSCFLPTATWHRRHKNWAPSFFLGISWQPIPPQLLSLDDRRGKPKHNNQHHIWFKNAENIPSWWKLCVLRTTRDDLIFASLAPCRVFSGFKGNNCRPLLSAFWGILHQWEGGPCSESFLFHMYFCKFLRKYLTSKM